MASDEMDITAFYNRLSSLGWHIPKHNVLMIGRDKDENNKFCQMEMTNI